MRRKDREVTDSQKIREIILSCRCCRLGFYDNGQVYIVPLLGKTPSVFCFLSQIPLDISTKSYYNTICYKYEIILITGGIR